MLAIKVVCSNTCFAQPFRICFEMHPRRSAISSFEIPSRPAGALIRDPCPGLALGEANGLVIRFRRVRKAGALLVSILDIWEVTHARHYATKTFKTKGYIF